MGILCALLLALGMALTSASGEAYADDITYYGQIDYFQSDDEKGYPEYNEDGTPKRDLAYVSLYGIKGSSGVFQLPDTFDVTIVDGDGNLTGSVIHDVVPYSLSIGRCYGSSEGQFETWAENGEIEALDLSACASLQAASLSLDDGYRPVGFTKLIVKDLDALESLSVWPGSSPFQLDLSGCESLKILALNKMDLPDLSSLSSSNLEVLDLSSCTGLSRLDVSAFPSLKRATISLSDATSLDLSSCEHLEDVRITQNSSLSSLKLPHGVADVDVSHNAIADTSALVEEYGEDSVLPQQNGVERPAGLYVIDEADAKGSAMVGSEYIFSLYGGAYIPAAEQRDAYSLEDYAKSGSPKNFKVQSSDPSVASISIDNDSSLVTIAAKAAGTATLTVSYSFEGEHGEYSGEQIVDFVVAGAPNHPTSLSAQDSVNVPMILSCRLCGNTHGGLELPLEFILANGSMPMTSDVLIQAESSDSGVVSASAIAKSDVSDSSHAKRYCINLSGLKAGSATVTVKASARVENGLQELCSRDISVEVVDVAPTMQVPESYSITYNKDVGSGLSVFGSSEYALASYAKDNARALIDTYCPGANLSHPTGSVVTVTSDNEGVAKVEQRDYQGFFITCEGAGKANITIEDVWGNKGTCELTIAERGEEFKKLSLKQTELTIKQGDEFDLATLVGGLDQLAPSTIGVDVATLLVFKTANGYIAPVTWGEANAEYGKRVSKVLGRNVGDTTISACMLMGDDLGGSLSYLNEWDVKEFGKLTLHVVAREDGDEDVPATSVVVSGAPSSMNVGDTQQLTASVEPDGCTDSVEWSSSDPGVLTVSETGLITAVANGSATVTATVGKIAATTGSIEVVTPVTGVTNVTLNETTVTIVGAGTKQLVATVEPGSATNKTVTWASDNGTVATVSEDGMVTSVGKGTAVITATSADGQHAATCTVTVKNPVTSIVVSPSSLDMIKGETATLSATLSGALAGAVDDASVSWGSSDSSVATVSSDGEVKAVKTGRAVIEAKVSEGVAASCIVEVTNPVTSVSLSETKKSATVGDAGFKLEAAVEPVDADDLTVSWKSSDSDVAAVDDAGNVTFVAVGEAVITAETSNGKSAQCVVTVKAKDVPAAGPSLARIAGDYARETSALVSAEAFGDGSCGSVVLARDDDFRDAMSAAGLAGSLGCPILLTSRDGLSDVAAAEVERLGAKSAYVIGGPGAMPGDFESELAELGCAVERVYGDASYDTSVRCAERIAELGGSDGGAAVVAYGQNFQDALSMSSFAYAHKVPIFLQTFGDTSAERGLTAEAVELINGSFAGKLYVAGGEGAVSSASLGAVGFDEGSGDVRLWGEDGYATSLAIAGYMVENKLLKADAVVVASGALQAKGLDALSGSALVGKDSGVLLLASGQPDYGAERVSDMLGFLSEHKDGVSSAYVLGGAYVMPSSVYDAVADVWGLPHEAA